ncbi:hypothetical protein GCM10010840_05520 [Deinococcus aerolatus]|uniref:Uncharacterized protein n=1 Tax=Deinococcus aerolatus TaxID=522487 RepID=A0ABQ2G1T0_9DEIO|nr:hypothetical protein [Deinococcus aerolatus]GGL70345.1 hypothetical protein GCM10010840_05520 [Deinococcus aerolatus]
MTDNRYGDKPLGKSVEEVENEQGNRVNSPLPGENRRDLDAAADFVPVVVSGGTGGSAGFPAVVNPDALTEDGGGSVDRPDQTRADTAVRGDVGQSDE